MELAIDQKAVIKTTFRTVVQNPSQFVENFYQKFFELDPSARKLFPDDIKTHGEKLMNLLTTLVVSVDVPAVVRPAASALGRRHVDYGVKKEQFATLGVAFQWALEKQLGAGFTPEVRVAWAALYQNVADMAIHAGYE